MADAGLFIGFCKKKDPFIGNKTYLPQTGRVQRKEKYVCFE
jgi:hypothetical protein